MGQSDNVRAFSRGLAVLRALNAQRYSTALQLSRTTEIPRATIYRLLETLVDEGFVQQVVGGDQYVLRSTVADLSSGIDRELIVIETAQPILKDLNKAIDFPVMLHSFQNNALVTRQVAQTTRFRQGVKVGSSVPILFSSPGRLSLVSLSQSRQREILTTLVNKVDRKAAQQFAGQPLDRLLDEVKRRGCGFRDGGFVPRTCSFALPVNIEGENHAFLTIVFSQTDTTLNRAIQSFMPIAQETVSEIERGATARIRTMQMRAAGSR